jgi:roadblock/LC7 domain-containing protein
MATLDDLINIDGVAAAGEFTADGKLVDYKAKMDMSQEMAEMTAQFFQHAGRLIRATEPDELGTPARLDVRWR